MQIIIPYVRTGTGTDIWYNTLVSGLKEKKINVKGITFPHYVQYFPFLMKRFIPKTSLHSIIHTNSWSGCAFSDIKIGKLIVTFHLDLYHFEYQSRKNFLEKFFHLIVKQYEKESIKKSSAQIAVSNYIRDRIRKIFNADNIKTIYNGIDVRIFKDSDNYKLNTSEVFSKNKIKLLYVGKISKRKGANYLPLIMEKLGDQYQLICIGERSLKNSLKKMGNIVVMGAMPRSNLIKFYFETDIFISPSISEGFGFAVSEAMACSKPIVAWSTTSLPELIIDGKGGFLCNCGNITEFVDCVKILSKEKKLRTDFGSFNRARVETLFSKENMILQHLELYRNLD